ncbi:hypothetical protein KFK09_016779 [Dendrobium nobile]|uniref:WRKY domain-containing protein n=1 Tax=Dendrobium nobile TaxID=94219 RepID=A0A8T3B0L3_DENNO|nr:hypothetical protein KFK09_016779 [Dendrobium nobile]
MVMGGSDQLPCHHKMVIGEITRSHQLVAKLRSLVLTSPPTSEWRPELANNLFEEVLESYKVSVSMLLRPCSCFAEASEVNCSKGSLAVEEGTMNAEDQPERMDIGYAHVSRKEPLSTASTTTTLHLDGHQWRMSGKKKTSNGDIPREEQKSWTIVTPAPHFDGHQWRKYGEKHISNSEFPRNYYRCSHFKEQGCHATKTIQQKEGNDEPPKFIVTYKMHHTCKSMTPIYSLFLESTTQSAPIISFAPGNTPQNKQTETYEDEKDFKRHDHIISSSNVPMLIDLNLSIESK